MSVRQTALHYAVSATQEEDSCTCAVAVGLAGKASISQGDTVRRGGGPDTSIQKQIPWFPKSGSMLPASDAVRVRLMYHGKLVVQSTHLNVAGCHTEALTALAVPCQL